MPDLGPAVGAFVDIVGPILKEALKALLSTALGTMFGSFGVAMLCFVIAYDNSIWRGLLAALLGLACCLAFGVVLIGKRTVARALMYGFSKLALGWRTAGLIFTNLLSVSEQEAMGSRGVTLARSAERLPLANAEQRLAGTISSLIRAESGGWLRRALQKRLLALVQAATLARFRRQNAEHGGVDLIVVRDELAQTIDETLMAQLESALTRLTVSLSLLAIGLSLTLAVLLKKFVHF